VRTERFLRAGVVVALVLGLTLAVGTAQAMTKKQADQARAEIRNMAQQTLARLYKLRPSAKGAISSAAGYAVFSNFGTKIFFFGGGAGKGIAVDQKTKKETFMKMVEAQAGLGLGVKKFRVVMVFEHQKDLNQFVNSGWEFGGQTSAAAKYGNDGGAFAGAISVSPGVWMYQLTDSGLALELTGKATKYYKDSDLN
jgi:lipid-binding SYLF domain-containing protein